MVITGVKMEDQPRGAFFIFSASMLEEIRERTGSDG